MGRQNFASCQTTDRADGFVILVTAELPGGELTSTFPHASQAKKPRSQSPPPARDRSYGNEELVWERGTANVPASLRSQEPTSFVARGD